MTTLNELTIKWGTSKGRDSYGYTTCTLYENGKRLAGCNGGGYDMRGTVFGDWLAMRYRDRLLALKPDDMPEQHHWEGTFSNGRRVDDGRYLYGLTFHDPNYDPGKAIIGKDCSDRTLTKKDTGSKGKTVAEAEADGVSFGLERYQAIYAASSKHATERHTIPSIDGGCGFESVRRIAEAIGLNAELHSTGRGRSSPELIIIRDANPGGVNGLLASNKSARKLMAKAGAV